MIGNLLLQPPTLYETLNQFLDFVRWHSTDALFWLKIEPEYVYFCRQGIKSIKIGIEATELYTVRLLIKIVQSFTDSQWKPNQIYLQMSRKKSLFDYRALANIPIFFEQPFTAIVFPRSLLWQTRSGLSRKVGTTGQDISDKNLIIPNTQIKEALSQTILTLLPERLCGINKIAKITGISVRTLQRELAKEGISYSRLVQKVRLQQALELLKNTQFQLVEISELLGYSNASHFSRAFKKWTGFSPLHFRRMYQEDK
jgi:AraC-like DNA-binding protein